MIIIESLERRQLFTTTLAADSVQAFSWSSGDASTSTQSMVWASMADDPIAVAARVAPQLKQMPAGERVVFLWQAMTASYTNFEVAHPAKFVETGPSIAHDLAWSKSFFAQLKALDAPVDRVVADNEAGFNTWILFAHINLAGPQVAVMKSIYNDPVAFAKLPPTLQTISPNDFANQFSDAGRTAFIAWNAWAQSVSNQAFKTAIVDPAQQVFGSSISISNYNDISSSTPLVDGNGWPEAGASAAIPGNVSSPSSYIFEGNKYSAYQKDWRWNRLIDNLNTIRAALNSPGANVTPWLSYPTYNGDNAPAAKSTWVWEQMVRQMVASGVKSFYYWNPSELTTASEDAFAKELFASLSTDGASPAGLPPIAFDADKIVTGNMTTTYADFLKFVDRVGATDITPSGLPVAASSAPLNASTPNLDLSVSTPSQPPQIDDAIASADQNSSTTTPDNNGDALPPPTTFTFSIQMGNGQIAASSFKKSDVSDQSLDSLANLLDAMAMR